ncbi:MAG: Dam family site-specific DNA-(adenine-N6)-methyltransferase [bacterium]
MAINSGKITPIIRWAGSKRKLLSSLLPFVPTTFERYFEPFAGSASLFFTLRPRNATLNDINPELMQFYEYVRAHPLLTYRKAAGYPRTRAHYLLIRSLAPSHLNELDRAARFFFLNRLCFNGLYRTNRKGLFNVPIGAKTGKFPSLKDIVKAARILRNVRLLNEDFEDVLSSVKRGDFVYLDPPYYSPRKRRRNEYGNNCFTTHDFPRLLRELEKLHSRGATFLLSYANDHNLLGQLQGYSVHQVAVRRCISGFIDQRIYATEIIVTNRT